MRFVKKEEAPLPQSSGIRGYVRQRICADMLDKVQGTFKILIVDDEGSRLLNSCMRMQDIMAHNITLVEYIANKRQPVKVSEALYFVAPTATNADLIVKDWAAGDMYKGAHIFFTSQSLDPVMSRLAGTAAAKKIATLVDMMITFCCPEPLVFNCEAKNDTVSFFGSNPNPQRVHEAAGHLMNALKAAGDCPAVRYYAASEACKTVAQHVSDHLDTESASAASNGILIILDRSIDVAAVLLHELTYECMVQDLAPLTGNVFKMPTGKGAHKEVIIDCEDPVWCAVRHDHIADAITKCNARVEKLKADNPQLANWDPKNSDVSLKNIGDAIRNLPAYQQQSMRLAIHTELSSNLMSKYKTFDLEAIVKLEQRIATGVDGQDSKMSTSALLKETNAQLSSQSLSRDAKLRLMLLFCACHGVEHAAALIKAAGFSDVEKRTLENLKHFNPQAKDKVAREKYTAGATYFETLRYKPYVKVILEGLAHNSLDQTAFPYIKGAAAHEATATVEAPAPSARVGGGLFGKKPAASTAVKGVTSVANVKPVGNLNLGHDEVIGIGSLKKIWIFMIGGMTVSEARSVYEVVRATKREVIIGCTSVISANSFCNEVSIIT